MVQTDQNTGPGGEGCAGAGAGAGGSADDSDSGSPLFIELLSRINKQHLEVNKGCTKGFGDQGPRVGRNLLAQESKQRGGTDLGVNKGDPFGWLPTVRWGLGI